MLSFIGHYILSSLIGWIGISGLVIVGCGAVAYLFPPFRRLAIEVAIIAAVVVGTYAKGYHDEYKHLKAQWAAAEEKARQAGDAARADALRDTANGVRDPYDSDDN